MQISVSRSSARSYFPAQPRPAWPRAPRRPTRKKWPISNAFPQCTPAFKNCFGQPCRSMSYLTTLPAWNPGPSSSLCLSRFSAAVRCCRAASCEPGEILAALNRPSRRFRCLQDRRRFPDIELRRGDAEMQLKTACWLSSSARRQNHGRRAYSGRGHILAIPREPVKKKLGYFLGAAMVDQDFTTAYLRFTADRRRTATPV